jgi:hypothetical protein
MVLFQGTYSQNVPTTLQEKGILLEEFTGIYCGNCPQGHEIARNLMNANENAYVVAIHSGYFAIPDDNDPDFRIPEGEILDIGLGANDYGYPSGTINRHPFEGKIILSRGSWIKSAKKIHADDAPVNILLTGTFDGTTRKLSVKAEGYYTMEVKESSHWLNIVVTENNIKGYQSGIGGGFDYIHNHMLRCFITQMDENVWGDEIVAPEQGNYFEFEYIFDLPTHINNIQIKPEDIEIVAFVCADKTEVLNVTGIKPDYINFEKPLNATLLKPVKEIGVRYGFDFFEAQLKNLSNKTITSAKFEVNINGEIQEIEWTGEISAFQTKPATIIVEPYSINESNSYSIKLTALNNENVVNSTISGVFNTPIETTQKILIDIKTDLYADENRFLIRNMKGDIVAEFGPYKPNLAATYKETITLDKNETYCFEVIDEWWDGIQTPNGFKLYNEDELLIIQAFNVKLYGDRVFIHTSKESSSIDYFNDKQAVSVFYNDLRQTIDISLKSVTAGRVNLSLYSVSGALLMEKSVSVDGEKNCEISIPASNYSKGVYLLKINHGTQNTTQKFIIH